MAKDADKVYTIPLRDAWKGPCKKRAKKCLFVVKEFVKKHMKTDNVKVGPELNHEVWKRGIKNPPRKLKVQVVPHEDSFWVELQGVKLELEKKEEKKKEKPAEEAKKTPKAEKEKKPAEAAKEKKPSRPRVKKDEKAKPKAAAEKKEDPSEKLPPKAKLS